MHVVFSARLTASRFFIRTQLKLEYRLAFLVRPASVFLFYFLILIGWLAWRMVPALRWHVCFNITVPCLVSFSIHHHHYI
jgi:hypothetical protein